MKDNIKKKTPLVNEDDSPQSEVNSVSEETMEELSNNKGDDEDE